LLETAKRQTPPPRPPAAAIPERLGDYRILGELGRGGMGVVYEAVQESLGRSVALKVLPGHARLDTQRRLRFGREAQAAARLHHTNIVPVFGVGEHEGLPYYVMQFIPGRGLDQVLADLRRGDSPPGSLPATQSFTSTPTPGPGPAPEPLPPPKSAAKHWEWQAVATLGIQVADALHYAHQQGILHRDVKPGNILVDAQGTAWVTDFGLAKLAGEPELTATGDLLGTLHYMAPESFTGQSDARSDVYGLGLVLSELCTLEPPQNVNPTELVRRVGGHERPGPRRINPLIPRDLETVILKATAAEPAQRYASAGELAEDLRRFLDDRPVLARRASALRRGWRWCRRNRLVASLAGVTMASLVLAAAVGWVGYAKTRDALASEALRRSEAENATKRVEDNLELSLQAFEDIFRNMFPQDRAAAFRRPVSERTPRPGQQVRLSAGPEENVALLESVLNFYDRFAEQNATNPRLHHDAAKAYWRVWLIQQRLRQPAKAEAALERAVALYENLVQKFPEVGDYRYELAELCATAGQKSEAGEKYLRRAAELADGLVSEHPEKPEYRLLAGEVHGRQGSILSRHGQAREAESHHRAAVRLLESKGPPLAPELALQLRASRLLAAESLVDRGEMGTARPLLQNAVRTVDMGLTAGDRPRSEALAATVLEYMRLARLCHRAGDEVLVAELVRKIKKLGSRGNHPPRSREATKP
jgi:tetratricopeptide (TPR) repeat protein